MNAILNQRQEKSWVIVHGYYTNNMGNILIKQAPFWTGSSHKHRWARFCKSWHFCCSASWNRWRRCRSKDTWCSQSHRISSETSTNSAMYVSWYHFSTRKMPRVNWLLSTRTFHMCHMWYVAHVAHVPHTTCDQVGSTNIWAACHTVFHIRKHARKYTYIKRMLAQYTYAKHMCYTRSTCITRGIYMC